MLFTTLAGCLLTGTAVDIQTSTRDSLTPVSRPTSRGRNDHSYSTASNPRKRLASRCTSAAAVKRRLVPEQDMDKSDSSDSNDIAGIFPPPLRVNTADIQTNTQDQSVPVFRPTARGRIDHSYSTASDPRKRLASRCTSAAAVKRRLVPEQDMDRSDSSDSDDIAGIFPLPLRVNTADIQTNTHDPSVPVSMQTSRGTDDHSYSTASDPSMPVSEITACDHPYSNIDKLFIKLVSHSKNFSCF